MNKPTNQQGFNEPHTRFPLKARNIQPYPPYIVGLFNKKDYFRHIIAIDGPAASGKGTIAKKLAKYLNFSHIDTGLGYRAVANEMARHKLCLTDDEKASKIAKGLDFGNLDVETLRVESVGEMAAKVAILPKLRKVMRQKQREYAKKQNGTIIDGRDIASVVFPDADIKLYITAEPKIRAKRRYLEMKNKGQSVSEAEILADIISRDKKDKNRKIAPLQKTADSHLIDTSNLSISQAFEMVKKIVKKKLG